MGELRVVLWLRRQRRDEGLRKLAGFAGIGVEQIRGMGSGAEACGAGVTTNATRTPLDAC
jgi:hypothetical protein